MTFLDLFAGIGGFRRGMELAGHTCLGFCEWNKAATASYISMHCITEEQREYLSTLDIRRRQQEILKEEYLNGEWYSDDIRSVDAGSMPRADCWCFGFPCQDISIAGKCLGFEGNRSSLFFAVTKIIRELGEEERPVYLFIENVKNLFSVNGGVDFAKLLIELDEIGYDAEWNVLNSKDFGVPQNRERVFIVGHLRGKRTTEVFPLPEADRANRIHQVGKYNNGRDNAIAYRVYDTDGLSPSLNTIEGGGREPCITLPTFCDGTIEAGGVNPMPVTAAIRARYQAGLTHHQKETTMVACPVSMTAVNMGEEKKDR